MPHTARHPGRLWLWLSIIVWKKGHWITSSTMSNPLLVSIQTVCNTCNASVNCQFAYCRVQVEHTKHKDVPKGHTTTHVEDTSSRAEGPPTSNCRRGLYPLRSEDMATHQSISIMASVCHGSVCFPTGWGTEGSETLEPASTKRYNMCSLCKRLG